MTDYERDTARMTGDWQGYADCLLEDIAALRERVRVLTEVARALVLAIEDDPIDTAQERNQYLWPRVDAVKAALSPRGVLDDHPRAEVAAFLERELPTIE